MSSLVLPFSKLKFGHNSEAFKNYLQSFIWADKSSYFVLIQRQKKSAQKC